MELYHGLQIVCLSLFQVRSLLPSENQEVIRVLLQPELVLFPQCQAKVHPQNSFLFHNYFLKIKRKTTKSLCSSTHADSNLWRRKKANYEKKKTLDKQSPSFTNEADFCKHVVISQELWKGLHTAPLRGRFHIVIMPLSFPKPAHKLKFVPQEINMNFAHSEWLSQMCPTHYLS